MCMIWSLTFDPSNIEGLAVDSYISWRKDTVKTLKEWDKMYVNHEKKTNKELGAIQAEAFIPLTDLWEANNNYFNIKKMIADGV